MIRQAELADFNSVVHIRKSVALDTDKLEDANYRVRSQRDGFLLPERLGVEEFEVDLESYKVAELGGWVVGYVCLHDKQTMAPDKAIWLHPDVKDIYYSNPHAYIYGIGVLPETKQRGVATEMMQDTEQRARIKNIPWLFSMIIISPVTNVASMMFHEKNGFQRIALGQLTQECGMDGFQNLLYGKQLS